MGNGDGAEGAVSGASEPGVSLEAIPLHSTNLLTVLDADGVVRYESPSIERIYGYDQRDLVGEQVASYFHPEDRERVVGAFEDVVAGDSGTTRAVEYRHRRADGSYCWVESVASGDPTPAGHYVVNTRDVTERKRREQELRRKTERLDEFASVVAHDLRNPLNVAQGHLEMSRQRGDDADLETVAHALERMETLTADLLTLAREGDRALDEGAVELAGAVETCWRTVDAGGASLEVETTSTVRADESRLQQLLANLLGNAVEHGGPDVTVVVGDLDDEPGFYVADDGDGIPPDEAERVFDLGYSSAAGGTGYGLAIVSSVADAHGWSVTAREGTDGGARFEVADVEPAQR